VVAIEKHQHLVIHQLCKAATALPVDLHPDVGLLVFVVVVINHQVDAALRAVFDKFFKAGQLFFGYLRHVFAQFQPVLAEVGIEIIGLVIFPIELLVLHAVFAKLYGVYLCVCRYEGSKSTVRIKARLPKCLFI
jgi:hypothetical protein